MDSTTLGALLGVSFLTIINVAVISFTYGKLTQKVKDLCDRVKRVETVLNSKGGG